MHGTQGIIASNRSFGTACGSFLAWLTVNYANLKEVMSFCLLLVSLIAALFGLWISWKTYLRSK